MRLRTRDQLLKSFESKYIKAGPDECWNWTAGTQHGGYGCFCVNYKSMGAHRHSWQFYRGEIPAELGVLHKCDNPRCVNPNHLFLGTRGDNNRDRSRKGRTCKGEDKPTAKLTEEKVRFIRKKYKYGDREFGMYGLARRFSVDVKTLESALKGKNWRHV